MEIGTDHIFCVEAKRLRDVSQWVDNSYVKYKIVEYLVMTTLIMSYRLNINHSPSLVPGKGLYIETSITHLLQLPICLK